MGCASSNPLVTSGKNFIETTKDSVSEFANKGEHMIEDAADSARDGMVHVKDAMGSAFETVENSLGTAVGKISNTFNHTKSDVGEAVDGLEDATEDAVHKANDSMVEAVSEAETVLASEAENAKEMVSHTVDDAEEMGSKATTEVTEFASEAKDMAFEKVEAVKEDVRHEVDEVHDGVLDTVESLKIEDMEHSLEIVDSDLSDAEKRVEEIAHRLPTPAPSPPPEVEAVKEESPTFWEAAADAILEQRIQSIDLEVPESSDLEAETGSLHPEEDLQLEDLELDMERPRGEDHLGEPLENLDKTSNKSYILSEN